MILVAPVLLGDEVRLFARRGKDPVKLETLSVSRSGQVTSLRFSVRGPGSRNGAEA